MMKYLRLPVAALAVLVAGSCGKAPGNYCDSIIIDQTDTLAAVSAAGVSDLRKLVPVENDATMGARLRIGTIGDVRATESNTVELQSFGNGESNDYLRPDQCKLFFEEAGHALDEAKTGTGPLQRSYVVHAIVSAMNDLSDCEGCVRKRAIFVSDLAEHSELFDCYDGKTLARLEKEPETFIKIIDGAYPRTKNYQGIEVWFVHAATPNDDNRFFLMNRMLTDYLTSRGANVKAPVGSLDGVR